MRRLWVGWRVFVAVLCGVAGCAAPTLSPRPPKHPEEITIPPLAEAKFENPPRYPDGTLNQDDTTRPMSPGMPGGPGGPPGAGGMSGMGAMNGMGSRGMGGGGMGGGGMSGRGY